MSPLSERILHLIGSLSLDSLPETLQGAVKTWKAAGCPDVQMPGADFPAWLNRKRRGKLVSLDQLSEVVGVSRTSLSRLEKGERYLSVGEWLKIAEALSLSGEERQEGEKLPRQQG